MTEYTYINNIELEIPLTAVKEICQSGDNEEAVKNNLNDFILNQLKKYSKEELIQAVEAWGIEEANTMTIDQLHRYILWLGAWDIFDYIKE